MDFGRMIRTRQFWLTVLMALAGLFLGTAWPQWKENTVFPSGMFLELTKESLQSRIVIFCIPVIAVIPWGEEYIRERQWNFLRFLIIRKGKKLYCLDRAVTTAISGMAVWLIASFGQLLFFFLLFFWKEEIFVFSRENFQEYFQILGRICLITSCLACLGGIVGAVSRSVYLSMGIPFVMYFSMVMLRERYLNWMYCMDPREWVLKEEYWGEQGRGLWMFFLLLWIGLTVIYEKILESRLEEI